MTLCSPATSRRSWRRRKRPQTRGPHEAAVDLAQMTHCQPLALMAAILDEHGNVADTPCLLEFARRHNFKIATIHDLIAHRRRTEKLVHCEAISPMPTQFGQFTAYAYSLVDNNPISPWSTAT